MNPELIDQEPQLDLSAKGPWQRSPGETAHSYAAFTKYLELGPEATLQQVADDLGKSLPAVCSLSARHYWMERAAAYRQQASQGFLAALEQDRVKQAELWRARVQIFREQQWEALQRMILVRTQMQTQLLAKPRQDIAYYEYARIEDTICRMGRTAAINADQAELEAPTSPLLSPDLEESLNKVYGASFDPEKYAHLVPPVVLGPPLPEIVCDPELPASSPVEPISVPAPIPAPVAASVPTPVTNANGAAPGPATAPPSAPVITPGSPPVPPINEPRVQELIAEPSKLKLESAPESPSVKATVPAHSPEVPEPASSPAPALTLPSPAISPPDPAPATRHRPRLGHNGKPIDPRYQYEGPCKPIPVGALNSPPPSPVSPEATPINSNVTRGTRG
jgi:hypothetical protein